MRKSWRDLMPDRVRRRKAALYIRLSEEAEQKALAAERRGDAVLFGVFSTSAISWYVRAMQWGVVPVVVEVDGPREGGLPRTAESFCVICHAPITVVLTAEPDLYCDRCR